MSTVDNRKDSKVAGTKFKMWVKKNKNQEEGSHIEMYHFITQVFFFSFRILWVLKNIQTHKLPVTKYIGMFRSLISELVLERMFSHIFTHLSISVSNDVLTLNTWKERKPHLHI